MSGSKFIYIIPSVGDDDFYEDDEAAILLVDWYHVGGNILDIGGCGDGGMPPPNRSVAVGGILIHLYAIGRGRNRLYWPWPHEFPDEAPWYIKPGAVRDKLGHPVNRPAKRRWAVVRVGRRGRRDRFLNAADVEGAVAAALSDEKGY